MPECAHLGSGSAGASPSRSSQTVWKPIPRGHHWSGASQPLASDMPSPMTVTKNPAMIHRAVRGPTASTRNRPLGVSISNQFRCHNPAAPVRAVPIPTKRDSLDMGGFYRGEELSAISSQQSVVSCQLSVVSESLGPSCHLSLVPCPLPLVTWPLAPQKIQTPRPLRSSCTGLTHASDCPDFARPDQH